MIVYDFYNHDDYFEKSVNSFKDRIRYLGGYKTVDGILVMVAKSFLSDYFLDLMQELKDNNIEIIANLRIPQNARRLTSEALKVIDQFRPFTTRIAISNTPLIEFVGGRHRAKRFYKMAKDVGCEWVSYVTHLTLCVDYRRSWGLRNFFAENNIFCICGCGYVLAGYLYDDFLVPDLWPTSLRYRNLYEEFGLTIERFSEYIKPVNIISGAGGAKGLATGTWVYLRRLNFKGYMCANRIIEPEPVRVYDEPSQHPKSTGPVPDDSGIYRMRRAMDITPKNQTITFNFEDCLLAPSSHEAALCSEEFGCPFNIHTYRTMHEYYRAGFDIGMTVPHCLQKEFKSFNSKDIFRKY